MMVTVWEPHMKKEHVAKFRVAELVALAVKGTHIKKGVALVGVAVGTRVGRGVPLVGVPVVRAVGLLVGEVDGADMTVPRI